jgi:hypothetical protein
MWEFDQPDCTMSVARRDETTTPLQALTMLNHNFTLDMSRFFTDRLANECGSDEEASIRRAYQHCFSRLPSQDELAACQELVKAHGLDALCRVLLNTSEMIYVR